MESQQSRIVCSNQECTYKTTVNNIYYSCSQNNMVNNMATVVVDTYSTINELVSKI